MWKNILLRMVVSLISLLYVLVESNSLKAQHPKHTRFPRTSIQQSWAEAPNNGLMEVMAKFDLIQADLTTEQINKIKSLNPNAIILPFYSTDWKRVMPDGENMDVDELVSVALEFRSKGFDGIYVDLWNLLSEGVANEAARKIRQAWPEGIHIVNAATGFNHSYDLNGLMFEDYPAFDADFEAGVQEIVKDWTSKAQQPHLLIMNQRSRDDEAVEDKSNAVADFWGRMRYATALSLLFDETYVMFNFGIEGSPHWATNWWFDEYSVDIGTPTGDAYALPNGVYAREFTNGIALVNTTFQPQTVSATALDRTYYRFLGGQRPDWNDGREFTSVNLDGWSMNGLDGRWGKPVGDGIILVSSPQKVVVSDIVIDDEFPGDTGLGHAVFVHNNIQGSFSHSGMSYESCNGDCNPFVYTAWSTYPMDNAHYAFPGDGSKWARWTPRIGVGGEYEIFIWYPDEVDQGLVNFSRGELASNAKMTIKHASGETSKEINQKLNGGQWNRVGIYRFNAGTSGFVQISNEANGIVIADAIKFVYQDSNQIVDRTAPDPPKGVRVSN